MQYAQLEILYKDNAKIKLKNVHNNESISFCATIQNCECYFVYFFSKSFTNYYYLYFIKVLQDKQFIF